MVGARGRWRVLRGSTIPSVGLIMRLAIPVYTFRKKKRDKERERDREQRKERKKKTKQDGQIIKKKRKEKKRTREEVVYLFSHAYSPYLSDIKCKVLIFYFWTNKKIPKIETPVVSLPLPAVVGIAINGFTGPIILLIHLKRGESRRAEGKETVEGER